MKAVGDDSASFNPHPPYDVFFMWQLSSSDSCGASVCDVTSDVSSLKMAF